MSRWLNTRRAPISLTIAALTVAPWVAASGIGCTADSAPAPSRRSAAPERRGAQSHHPAVPATEGNAAAVVAAADADAGAALAVSEAAASANDATLVDLSKVAPSVRLDMRYATTRNFTGRAFYPVARCLLVPDAARRLAKVASRLAISGHGLLVWDCYRPFAVQQQLWDHVRDRRYVAKPVESAAGTPVRGSKHNRGAAVDLTLTDARGTPLKMPTEFDDFSPRAHRDNQTAPRRAQQNAHILERAMVAEGFVPLATEWWHFDAPSWRSYPLLDVPLR